jgi:hypothetical protein
MNLALQDKAVELAWRQWTALGVSGVAPLPEHGLDLEALIAFTPFISAADPRLESECLDWCVRISSHHISVSRLRRVARMFKPHAAPDAVDLSSIAMAGQADRAIHHRGLDLSGKSRPPRLEHPALIQLRSRHIFGIGARADAVTALVMNPRETVRLSSMDPGYAKRTMAFALEDLASAGVVTKLMMNQTAHYKLIQEAPLRSLLAPLPTKLPRWIERLVLVAALLSTWRRMPDHAAASYAVELAKVLDRLRPLAAALGENPPTTGRPSVLLEKIATWSQALLDP